MRHCFGAFSSSIFGNLNFSKSFSSKEASKSDFQIRSEPWLGSIHHPSQNLPRLLLELIIERLCIAVVSEFGVKRTKNGKVSGQLGF